MDFGNIDESLTQLNNDILAGNMPDILVVNDKIQMDNLVKKGLLADIDALIAGDEDLSKVAFMDNVFDAYRIDGKLYQVIPFFQVNTFIGKKSVLGDITGWNMEEFMAYASGLGEGRALSEKSPGMDFYPMPCSTAEVIILIQTPENATLIPMNL